MELKEFGNIKVHLTTTDETIEVVNKKLHDKDKFKLFFLNAYCYILAQNNPTYAYNLNHADLVLNDGVGMEFGARFFGFRFYENLNGTDLIPKILDNAEKNGFSVYLLGGLPGVADEAAWQFRKRYPDISIAGSSDGYFKDENQVIEKINRAKPDILIVALGAPYQENWISEHFDEINARLFMGVGAFLDFSSKRVRRAPKWMRKAKMEWVYRLVHEPKRLWKRTILGTPQFLYYLLKNR